MLWLCVNVLFYLEKNNVMYTNTLLIYLLGVFVYALVWLFLNARCVFLPAPNVQVSLPYKRLDAKSSLWSLTLIWNLCTF